jgi:hypothetical protein
MSDLQQNTRKLTRRSVAHAPATDQAPIAIFYPSHAKDRSTSAPSTSISYYREQP